MLLPENPKKWPQLWEALASQLSVTPMVSVVENGIGNSLAKAKALSRSEAELTLARLQQAQLCRISANRQIAISPHFAGRLEGETVTVTDMLTAPSEDSSTVDENKLRSDLEIAVINLLFTESGVNYVLVPLTIAPWEMPDAAVSVVAKGLLFSKKGE